MYSRRPATPPLTLYSQLLCPQAQSHNNDGRFTSDSATGACVTVGCGGHGITGAGPGVQVLRTADSDFIAATSCQSNCCKAALTMLFSGQLRGAFAFNLELVTIRPNRDAAKLCFNCGRQTKPRQCSQSPVTKDRDTQPRITVGRVCNALCAKQAGQHRRASACSSFVELSPGTECIPRLCSGPFLPCT